MIFDRPNCFGQLQIVLSGPNSFGRIQIILVRFKLLFPGLIFIIWTRPKQIRRVQNEWYSTKMIWTAINYFGPIEYKRTRHKIIHFCKVLRSFSKPIHKLSKWSNERAYLLNFFGISSHHTFHFSCNKWEMFPPYSPFSCNKWKKKSL